MTAATAKVPACVICATNPRTHGMHCRECDEFECERHGNELPISCHGVRVCWSCHDDDGCPHQEDECVDCGKSLACTNLLHPAESIMVAESGRCASCAMATVGGGA